MRNYDGVEIDYESEDRKPIDRKNTVPPTLCLLLWEEGLDAGMLLVPASWGEHYPPFAESREVEVVVADGLTWNLTSYRLMFEYMDDGLFHLTIMDNLGVEIDYPKAETEPETEAGTEAETELEAEAESAASEA
ncbi:hypothetical protein ACFE04_021827 [Oxalis oulophora]